MIRTILQEYGYSWRLTRKSIFYQKISRRLVKTLPFIPSHQPYNITISHEKQFIWFRVPKVGTRTVFNWLGQADVSLDAVGPYNCHYPVQFYKSYFKFAFVRNPWDRLVSCWYNKVIDSNYFRLSQPDRLKLHIFEYFVDWVAAKNIETCDRHLRLQSRLIDLNQLDFLGRFETMDTDLLEVAHTLGLVEVTIERKNVTENRQPYQAYYNDTLRQKVADIYRKDIRLFGYKF